MQKRTLIPLFVSCNLLQPVRLEGPRDYSEISDKCYKMRKMSAKTVIIQILHPQFKLVSS